MKKIAPVCSLSKIVHFSLVDSGVTPVRNKCLCMIVYFESDTIYWVLIFFPGLVIAPKMMYPVPL